MKSEDGSVEVVRAAGTLTAKATIEVVRIEGGPVPRVSLAITAYDDRFNLRGARRNETSLRVGDFYETVVTLDLPGTASGEAAG